MICATQNAKDYTADTLFHPLGPQLGGQTDTEVLRALLKGTSGLSLSELGVALHAAKGGLSLKAVLSL